MRRTAAVLLVGAAVVGLAVVVPGVRPVLATVLVVIAVAVLALLLVVVITLVLLLLRADRDVRADPDLERPPPRHDGGIAGLTDPTRTTSELMERLRQATTSPHFDVATRHDRALDSAAHLLRNWVRGPDRAAAASVNDEVGRLLVRMADTPGRSPTDVERLRRVGAPGFVPRGHDWRALGRELDTSRGVILGARVLVAGRRWRETTAAYHRLVVAVTFPPID